jgi:hypothetical protein
MVELPPRQTDADTRRHEDVAWREKGRAEDLAWREKVRAEDRTWREQVRAEDLAWREQVRAEDLAWRNEARATDLANKQCLVHGLALLAAAQNAKPATPTEELARMAQEFTQWISGADGTTGSGN